MADVQFKKPASTRFLPFSRVSSYREIVRQFTPNWFALTMGTGIVFLVLSGLLEFTCCCVRLLILKSVPIQTSSSSMTLISSSILFL